VGERSIVVSVGSVNVAGIQEKSRDRKRGKNISKYTTDIHYYPTVHFPGRLKWSGANTRETAVDKMIRNS
jgi:hypothetical protein